MLTLCLLVGYQLYGTTDTTHPQEWVLLALTPPSPCSCLHGLNGQPADFCAVVADFQEPLFHRGSNCVFDLGP